MSLLLLSGPVTSIFSQTPISGIINKYGRVNSIGTDFVIVNDETQFQQFQAGDTILLIQMKGVRIDSRELSGYGSSGFQYGATGAHEFLTVLSVDDVTNKIIFRNNIISSYDVAGRVQIIKVPSYNRAVVTGTLTCQPWDSTSKVGGVLVAIVWKTLSLNGNIDVTGKGFKGGATAPGLGICSMNIPVWDRYAYSGLTDSAGFKGEGLAINADTTGIGTPPFFSIYPTFAKGKGKNYNGGGGGDGRYSGGGGGSNYGAGGIGDKETNACSPNYPIGGLGGIQISGSGLDGGLFLGGGGGASTWQAVGSPTAGGNGGGIIILISDEIKGKGHSILADGATPAGTASGQAGAGGGGGGGSIAIYLQSYSSIDSSALTISAKGGYGGNNSATNAFGAGGGGGGGYINTSAVSLPSNVLKPVGGGNAGTRQGVTGATGGASGKSITAFVPMLNGFLFNSIRSSVSGTQIDSICSNVTPKPITGTSPVGGAGPSYSYTWLKSLNANGPWTPISGATLKDYTPVSPEPATFWIRRRVKDDGSALVDTSKAVKIVVQQAISGNTIGRDTTICFNQNPLPLIATGTVTGGYGNPHYHWLQNNDNNWSSYANADGADSTSQSFDPSALTFTTYYKRKITSGHCVDYSNAVTVAVLTSITGNRILRPDSVICEGFLFNTLDATSAGDAAGTYTYQWQDSIATGSWLPAAGVNTGTAHDPDTSQFASVEQLYFRRVVFSGPYDVCRSNSQPILLTRYHKIKNNIISGDTTICALNTPGQLTGETPTQGLVGSYAYEWQDSTRGGTWVTKSTSLSPFNPPVLTDTTWYKRIVSSSVCRDVSNLVVVNVHKSITNYSIAPDTTICNASQPNKLRGAAPGGGDGATYLFQWSVSADNVSFSDISVSGTLKDYQPSSLTQDTWYKRNTLSGQCTVESNTIKVTVLPSIAGNLITPDKAAVCYNTTPGPITDAGLTGGSGAGTYLYQWQDSIAGNSWLNAAGATATQQFYTPQALTKKTWYRRIVTSGPAGCCRNISPAAVIDTVTLPTAAISASPDTTICEGADVRFRVHLTGSAPWNITYKENGADVTEAPVSGTDPVITRKPVLPGSSGMTQFVYTLGSVLDQNNCSAAILTGNRKANVYRVPVADAGPASDESCGAAGYQLNALSTDFPGKWYYPPQVVDSSAANINRNVTIGIDPAFSPPSVSYDFYWKETNGICVDSDFIHVTFYTPVASVYAGKDIDTVSFDYTVHLNADPVQSWETGEWTVREGAGTFSNSTSNVTTVNDVAKGTNIYLWTVSNGKCKLEDELKVTISDIVVPKGISPNNDSYNNTLVIGGIDLTRQDAELSIINGAGTEVFKTTNRNGENWKEWDGTNSQGDELPDGTYYFLLKVVSDNGRLLKQGGFIILKRH